MLKSLVLIAAAFAFTAAHAQFKPDCRDPLIAKYRADAKASPDWGFEWLSRQKKSEVLEHLTWLQIEDFTEEMRERATKLLKTKGTEVYQLDWNAVANRGSSYIIAEGGTCKVLMEFTFASEE